MERGHRQFEAFAAKGAAIKRVVELDLIAALCKDGNKPSRDQLEKADLLGYSVRLECTLHALIAFLVHSGIADKEEMFAELARYLRDDLNGFLSNIEKQRGRSIRNRIAMFARAAERETQLENDDA